VTPAVVGVVGAGTMGTGIAQVCLVAGHPVLLHDADAAAVERARAVIDTGLDRLVERGRLPAAHRLAVLGRLRAVGSVGALAGASAVMIEAAVEDLAVKQSIFQEADRHAAPDALLATNTSALSVSAIAAPTRRPQRVVGLHFFNPAPLMELVEVAAGDATDAEPLRMSVAFVEGLGKTAVVCRDAPGFIVNRINRPFTLEPLRILGSGRSTVAEIDDAIEGAGYPMGPFRLIDLVGVDVNLAVAKALYAAFREAPRFRPSPIQETMVAEGRLGRKCGLGFYRYGPERTTRTVEPVPGVTAAALRLSPAQIVERVELATINEAYRAVGEGVADPSDIDRAMRLGAGHPQGPFERAGSVGLRRIVERLRALQATVSDISGDQYEVAPTLWQMATI
jgi:3-hydroxybutyryl-CoA dehydrogenase